MLFNYLINLNSDSIKTSIWIGPKIAIEQFIDLILSTNHQSISNMHLVALKYVNTIEKNLLKQIINVNKAISFLMVQRS